jgi:hypothetical protein
VHSTSFGFLTGASLTGTAVGPVLGGLVAARSITGVFVLGVVILPAWRLPCAADGRRRTRSGGPGRSGESGG